MEEFLLGREDAIQQEEADFNEGRFSDKVLNLIPSVQELATCIRVSYGRGTTSGVLKSWVEHEHVGLGIQVPDVHVFFTK